MKTPPRPKKNIRTKRSTCSARLLRSFRVALLLGFSFYIPSVKISVATAMLIGMMYAMLVTRADPQKTISKFFDGMGKGYGSILGHHHCRRRVRLRSSRHGVIDLFVNYLTHANEVAKIGGSVGPYVFRRPDGPPATPPRSPSTKPSRLTPQNSA